MAYLTIVYNKLQFRNQTVKDGNLTECQQNILVYNGDQPNLMHVNVLCIFPSHVKIIF